MLVDTHAHLTFPKLVSEREEVVARAEAAGVTRIIDVGTNPETSLRAREGARQDSRVFASAGYHPHDSESATDKGLSTIETLLADERVVAVGETGLDFFRDYAPRDTQEGLFREHIRLARQFNLPLILHSRGAEDEVLDVLEEMGAEAVGGVLHCFGGTMDQAKRAVDCGFYLGFGGTVTFKNSDSLEVATSTARDRVLLETDCPYLAPVPFRGKRNEPAYVPHIAQCIAEATATTIEALAEQTTENAVRLFDLEV